MPSASTPLRFQLDDEDVSRIAVEVAALLKAQPRVGWLDVRRAADYTSLSEDAIRTASKRGRLVGHKGKSGRLVFRVRGPRRLHDDPGLNQEGPMSSNLVPLPVDPTNAPAPRQRPGARTQEIEAPMSTTTVAPSRTKLGSLGYGQGSVWQRADGTLYHVYYDGTRRA